MAFHRWAMIGSLALVPALARADPRPGRETATEDEALYSCQARTAAVAVAFKPELELKELITWAMGFTCKSFLYDPRIVAAGKKLTLMVPEKMSPPDAYQTFLAALSTVGLTVVAKRGVLRIVEAAAARHEDLPIYARQIPSDGDKMIRAVIRPSHVSAETLRQALTAIKSDAGDISTVGATLIVTDYASSLHGMMSLKQLVDVPGASDGIYTIAVHHGDATRLAQVVTAMFVSSAGAAPAGAAGAARPAAEPGASELAPPRLVVDDRSNTLVVSASEPTYQRVRALVARLDVPVAMESGSSIHAYQLSSAVAEEVAATLTKSLSGEGGQARTQRPAGATTSPEAAPDAPAAGARAGALAGLGATVQGAVHIVADRSTNKLLITASTHDFLVLRDVIRELDQPRRQVYIEAMILEVDVSNGAKAGASFHAGASVNGSGLGFGGVQLPDLSSASPSSALSTGGLLGGLLGGTLDTTDLLGKSIPSYGVLIQALATSTSTNILSTPSLIALDNEEAKSKIGENIPYIKGVVPATTGTTSTTLTTNVERQALELELDIKPHIAADDTVLLEIKHSAAGKKDESTTLGPTWTTRSIETRVVVRDQQTVLIGGLMQDSDTDSVSKVPLLGDLPLLGYLFKYTTRSKHKTNLLILLTPYIVKDQGDIEEIQQRKRRQNDEFFQSFAVLDRMKLEPHVDYRHKRGLIEEIHRAVLDMEAQAETSAPPALSGVTDGPIGAPDPASGESPAAAEPIASPRPRARPPASDVSVELPAGARSREARELPR